ncbi:MAG: GNAT family N-acetyltransferase, partial [Betaproteobacteria bacterium]|nr:GNAT family N-acetyltransferase [Betaproteobacteria bacterium]
MITVRLAEPRDAADIQRIFERTLREADWLPKGADPDTDFLRNSGGETVYVGLSPQGEVAGFLSLYTPGKFIHHLYVES